MGGEGSGRKRDESIERRAAWTRRKIEKDKAVKAGLSTWLRQKNGGKK